MVVYTCKKYGELNYFTPHAFWNITDFDAKCEKWETINTVTLENGELRNKYKSNTGLHDNKVKVTEFEKWCGAMLEGGAIAGVNVFDKVHSEYSFYGR
jgi:hypothetical protein